MNLIVPPIVETMCTGFKVGAEKRIRGKLWRVEFYTSGETRLFRDGNAAPAKATELPNAVLDFVQDARMSAALMSGAA